jgi:glycosyltransferase involved in cell wall biosynthesis
MPQPLERATFVAYRDRLAPRSELTFLTRQYAAFERLAPIWVGRRRDLGFDQLGPERLILGREGWVGAVERELFKHFGRLPAEPDLKARRPRLVHAHFGRGGALALPLARALRLPLVVNFYGADATKDKPYRAFPPSIYGMRLEALKRESALFLCVSAFIRERLIARGFPEHKLEVHYSGVDIGPDYGWTGRDAEPYVLFAARFVEKKGAPTLIEAVRRLQAEGRGLRLILIGEGPMEAQLRQAAAGLAGVEFRGWMANDELRRILRGALALAVPSQRASDGDEEGLPTVALEAMAAGTPVIGSRHAGIGEAVTDGVTGFLTAERDPDAVAAAIAKLMDSAELRLRLGENARRAAEENFDMRAQSRRLERRLLGVAEAASA